MAGVRNISPYDVWRGAIQALVFMHANEIHDQTQASLEEETLRPCLLLHKTRVCVRDGFATPPVFVGELLLPNSSQVAQQDQIDFHDNNINGH